MKAVIKPSMELFDITDLIWQKCDSIFCCHIPVYILGVLLHCHLGLVFRYSDIYVFIWVGFCCWATRQCSCTLPVCPAGISWDFQFLVLGTLAHSFYCSRHLGSRSSGFRGEYQRWITLLIIIKNRAAYIMTNICHTLYYKLIINWSNRTVMNSI